ncbi:MAG: PAS domain S-box protein [Hyphomicrobiaceae bacterium]
METAFIQIPHYVFDAAAVVLLIAVAALARSYVRWRRAERALLLANAQLSTLADAGSQRLEAILDSTLSGIVTIKTNGIIDSANRATEDLTGYTRAEIIGRNVAMLMPEPHATAHDSYLERYLSTGERQIIGIGRDVEVRRKDGTTVPIHLAVSEFEISGERYFTGILTDITDREAATARLRETERQLAQAQKMEAVGQLTGGLAHDFNNLLTVITGNLELLDMTLDDEKSRDMVRRANEAARMGARLTGRLLTFSRRRTLQPVVLDINEAVLGLTELLRRSLGENISVDWNLVGKVWPTQVDQSEIENAILNLAINARDAMPGGGRIVIETSNATLTDLDVDTLTDAVPGDYVRLALSDNGAGMSTDIVARAFEPFFTTKEPGRGTGLGLSTIYGFVRQSGGFARIYSEVGSGTTVTIYLPRHNGAAPVHAAGASDPGALAAKGEVVLVVEDNDEVRNLTVRRLRELGYEVLVAVNGPAAVELLEKTDNVELVFSDVIMPGGMSGFDVAAWVAKNRPGIKVLLTSGFAPDLAQEHNATGIAPPLLRKPYTQRELAGAVRASLAEG